ncbi:FAD-linked oxidase C-terminal domain-containing protein [Gemmatimonas groenlandica]|uniref:FAD-binding protein n=1 Tax=Gemmatimonas groenlandica TaxID=2732249 RepID=A0A6M4IRW4_9BACT|nr:FAD-linked oxidase C-terminal domain-containing protein [Gemmatimonas groenlandica]QJR36176.1 FAD-binding protein [Gemmatimonas groenlandica]
MRDALLATLSAIVGPRWVKSRAPELVAYDADGLPGYRALPNLAVFPGTQSEVVAVVKALAAAGVSFVPRGAGTGLSGGALANDVVLLGLNRLTQILRVDPVNRIAVVEPGVVNAKLSRAVAPYGLQYAPDPSSQSVCTIGGNVAENAGGPHCLKYGVTLNHVVECLVVLPDGRFIRAGSAFGESDEYDVLGLFVGSEGCFGVATEITVRLVPLPDSVHTMLADFPSVNAAARAVSRIVATGIVPAALEMMDNATIRAVEASIYAAGYPTDAAAVLLCEVDGIADGLDEDVAIIRECCMESGARNVLVASTEADRVRLWQGRKKAFGAMGRIAPSLVVQDAVVPRTRLPDVLETIHEIATRYGVQVCNVFHAGDGNLHPNIPYDANDADASARVHAAMSEIMLACIAAGGTITGEHGVGLDKLPYMESLFTAESLSAMCTIRDVFDPDRRANPGKVVPVHSCKEWHRGGNRA